MYHILKASAIVLLASHSCYGGSLRVGDTIATSNGLNSPTITTPATATTTHVAGLGIGEVCSAHSECASQFCKIDRYGFDDPHLFLCAKKKGNSTFGGVCRSDSDCINMDCNGGVCGTCESTLHCNVIRHIF